MKRRVRDRLGRLDPEAVLDGGRLAGPASLVLIGGGVEAVDGVQVPEEPDLLLDYLRLLGRGEGPRQPVEPSGPQVRTCTSCGRRAPVRLDPEGSWAWCSACGRAA
jgi:hypothetical protein